MPWLTTRKRRPLPCFRQVSLYIQCHHGSQRCGARNDAAWDRQAGGITSPARFCARIAPWDTQTPRHLMLTELNAPPACQVHAISCRPQIILEQSGFRRCGAGFFTSQNSSEKCLSCEDQADRYQQDSGQTRCTACPSNTRRTLAAAAFKSISGTQTCSDAHAHKRTFNFIVPHHMCAHMQALHDSRYE